MCTLPFLIFLFRSSPILLYCRTIMTTIKQYWFRKSGKNIGRKLISFMTTCAANERAKWRTENKRDWKICCQSTNHNVVATSNLRRANCTILKFRYKYHLFNHIRRTATAPTAKCVRLKSVTGIIQTKLATIVPTAWHSYACSSLKC